MAAAKKSRKPARPAAKNGRQTSRFWLMYPPKLIQRPVIWELARKFPVVTNLRQVSVTDEIGIVCLEVEGQRADIKAGVKWLMSLGVKVEPVEISVLES